MSLKTRISDDIKNAMKSKDVKRLSVLRMMLSDIKYAQAQVNLQAELPEEEVVKVVAGYLKKLEKSLGDYPEGESRSAIVEETKIVAEYLPKRASADEIEKIIQNVLKDSAERNFGAVMKLVLEKLGPGCDGKMVSQILKSQLG